MMARQLVLVGLIGALCGIAKADDTTEFPFSAADTAFASAAAPTAAELGQTWYVIGEAENPNVPGDNTGYWPDGKYRVPGESGYFYEKPAITTSTDAFGTQSVTWKEQTFGAETNKLYATLTYTGSMVSTGVAMTSGNKDSDECAESFECRMVAAQSMLLCKLLVTDNRPTCHQYSGRVIYIGFQQLSTAP